MIIPNGFKLKLLVHEGVNSFISKNVENSMREGVNSFSSVSKDSGS